MLDTNHQNSSCTYADYIVSYLYGEADEREKTVFEAHLTNCENCADELSAFGFVRSSVQQWRTEEFLPMQIPSIEIPFEKSTEITADSSEKHSLLANLRRLFTLSPAWTAGFALLAVCVGLTLFVINFSDSTEIAIKNNEPVKSAVLPIIEQPAKINSEEITQNDSPDKSSETKNTMPEMKNTPRTAAKKSVEKVSNNTKQTSKNETVAQNSDNSFAPVHKARISKGVNSSTVAGNLRVPKLVEVDEVKDSSLRLSDLMAEVENK